MRLPICAFISLNCNSLFGNYQKTNYSYNGSDGGLVDFRETWQNSILSGIIRPFRRKPIDIDSEDPIINTDDCKTIVNEIIRAKTERLKSSVQKRFIRGILSLNSENGGVFIDLDGISTSEVGEGLSKALIWFSGKYESFFNPNSLNVDLSESKIDRNCTFEEIGIKRVRMSGIEGNPTFAQKVHIPRVISYLLDDNGKDRSQNWMSKVAQTDDSVGLFYHSSNGSGKTYSYLLPIIEVGRGSTAIIVPTRELAVQIHDIAKSISPQSVNNYLLIGGANIKNQIERLKTLETHESSLFVTTPGRFIDLTSRKILNIKNISNFIFDEYDSYFTLQKNSDAFAAKDTFRSIIQTIYKIKSNSQVSGNSQVTGNSRERNKKIIFCSAINREAQVTSLIRNEEIGKSDSNGEQSGSVTHFLVTYGRGSDKVAVFKRLLDLKPRGKSVLVFVNSHEHVDFLSKVIKTYLPNAQLIRLSANDSKIDRQKEFAKIQELNSKSNLSNLDICHEKDFNEKDFNEKDFHENDFHEKDFHENDSSTLNAIDRRKSCISNICVTTDMASRGIDFSAFTFLVNYSLPNDVLTYNNRCGRLNFSGRRGVCLSLCQGSQIPKFGRVIFKKLSVPIHSVDPIQGILFKKRSQCIPYVVDGRQPDRNVL